MSERPFCGEYPYIFSVYGYFPGPLQKNLMEKKSLYAMMFPRVMAALFSVSAVLSCEILDDDPEKHVSDVSSAYIGLHEVARIMASLPLGVEQVGEVHDAVSSSSRNGYDDEYLMSDLFGTPGSGIGDDLSPTRSSDRYGTPLRDMLREHVESAYSTRSSGWSSAMDPETFLRALSASDIQIYWPFSEDWDGSSIPVVTFDPEDGTDVNTGYRIVSDGAGRRVEEVLVDEEMASMEPVWVISRNSDASYTSIEMLRRENPDWASGGEIIVRPEPVSRSSGFRTLLMRDFTMHRNYDTWFAGASEFFVKIGAVSDFTASTEAELKLYSPLITDFMVVVRRNQVGKPQPFNVVLVSDWPQQMTHCAFMITEDDGGTRTSWECTALVRIASKSYGIEIDLPFNSRDDIVWRGQLSERWMEENSEVTGHFGDVDLTFEVVEN